VVNFPAFEKSLLLRTFFVHQFLQHFRFITLSIPNVEKAFSFVTEVRVEDCLSFYGGINTNKKKNFAGLQSGEQIISSLQIIKFVGKNCIHFIETLLITL